MEDKSGVVTAVETTPGHVDEGKRMMALVEQHQQTTGQSAETVIADCKYGTVANFVAAQQQGLTTHMADLARSQNPSRELEEIFPPEAFEYEEKTDTYVCPANQRLRRRNYHPARHYWEYAGRREVCAGCRLRSACTRNKMGRTVNRHELQSLLDQGRQQSLSEAAQADRKRRQHWMEGSFADAANNHGFKRSRWRGLWKQTIQDLLIATCQNLRKLGKAIFGLSGWIMNTLAQLWMTLTSIITLFDLFEFDLKTNPAQG